MKYKKILGLCLLVCFGESAYAQISPNNANQKLSSAAKQKILRGGINVNALLNNNSNDLIIEYEAAEASNKTGQDLRNYVAGRKKNIRTRFQAMNGMELLRDYNALPVSFHRINNRDTLVQVLNDANVKAVYPNRTSYAGTTQSYELIGQVASAVKGFNGDGTTVAVLDTGANYKHADFGSCTAVGTPSSCRISYSVEIAANDYTLDSNGHGSNVAGIVSKVAPNAKIAALDVFSGSGASDSNLISALNWVANNAIALNIKSVNLSLGLPGSYYSSTCTNSSLTTSFANVRKVGVIPVVASGNEASTKGITYPACTAGAVSVGAVYDSNMGSVRYSNCSDSSTYSDKVTCFSNSGSNLTLLAPGSQMTAGGYTQSGTSQAAPHVAAAIAVLRASNAIPNETLEQSVARLTSTGTLVTDSRNMVKTPRLNLLAALTGVTATPTPTIPETPVVTPSPVTPTPTPTAPVTPTPEKNCRTYFFVTICSG